MKILLAICLLFLISTSYSQTVVNHAVEPVGIYKEIHMENDMRVCKLLADSTYDGRNKLIDSIEKNANIYTPPVLYFLSNVLFSLKKYNDATYWFYIAQLRARYDVNRCADKTANASEYNETFGPAINTYAIKDADNLEIIIKKVIAFVRDNEERYDQRWINLTGMAAMEAGLDGKVKNKKLSADEKQWPAIKTKTINEYYAGFLEVLPTLKKKQ